MSWESIGSVDTGEMPDDEKWILFCLGLAKNYVQFVCGLPPDESKLEVTWGEHELGNYPTLAIWYDLDAPCEYATAAEDALDAFNKHVSWLELKDFWRNQADEENEWEKDADDD